MFVSPQNVYVDILVPQAMVEGFGRCLGNEGGARKDGISALIRDPRELPRTQREVCDLEEGLTQPCRHPDGRLLAPKTEK